MGDRIPSVEEALAYADGYQHALDDCDRADVAELIGKLAAEESRHCFTKAKLQIAERQLAAKAATHVTAMEERTACVRWLDGRAASLPTEKPLGSNTEHDNRVRAMAMRSAAGAIQRGAHLRDTDGSGEAGQTAQQAGPKGREPGPEQSEGIAQ